MSQEADPGAASSHGDGWRAALRLFGPCLVFMLAGISTTVLLTRFYLTTQRARAQEHFAAWCDERQQVLGRSIDTQIESLFGLRALFDSSEYVTPEEFDRFTTATLQRHSGIRSLGYLRNVSDAQRDAIEAYYSKLLGSPFVIMDFDMREGLIPAPRRPAYTPLVYAQARDVARIGLDARGAPGLVATMEAAARRDAVSGFIGPMPGDDQRIVHIYLPVFSRDTRGHQGADRLVDGYVRLRFVLQEITGGVARQATEAGIQMQLLETPVSVSDTGRGEVVGDTGAWWKPQPMEWHGGIAIADRALSLQFRATDRYVGRNPPLPVWLLPAIGAMVTLLGTIGTFLLTRSRLRLEGISRNLAAEMRERRLSEERTAESEERYRVLVENSPDAILMIRRSVVMFVNRATVELFRAKNAEELIGRSAIDRVHPDFRTIAAERVDRMMRERIILPAFEERLIRLDGTLVDVEVRSVPFVVDGETVLQVTIRDITARRQAERDRVSLETALRQSQRLEAIGTLAGGIAHDFNNILSSIVGNIGLVMDDLPKGHPVRQSAHEIRNATNRARDLVKRLMAFSRHQEAPQSPLDLAPIVEEVQQLLRPTLPAGVVLHCSVPADTPPVIADATQMHQVLVNLCTNAWQAMTKGRGEIRILATTLSAEQARQESKMSRTEAARYVRIEVRDDGSGIPAEIIDRIFDPFFTTKPAGEGSGLGLAVVHGIVQSHHGAIIAQSKEGTGSSFFIYLRASEQAARPANAGAGERPRGENQHVLYVDDEEPLVLLVTRILERNGYRCSATTDPREAIDWVDRDPQSFDLVMTDMNMPGMSGIDVAREVLARRPDLPVVITTGYVRASDMAATRTLGIRDLILKPDTIDELAALVGRYLREPARAAP